MAKSKRSFSKFENEKIRQKKRNDKRIKKDARKATKMEKPGIPFAYTDQFGNLSDTPIEKNLKESVDVDSIEISVPKKVIEDIDPIRNGKVAYYDSSKGYGFIIDSDTQEKYFTHVSAIIDQIVENDTVTFELELGEKGMNAIRVSKIE